MFELATKFKPDVALPFEIAVAAGYRCAELWTGPAILDSLSNVIALAHRFPLRYALHFPNRRDLTPEQLRSVVELYRALECRSMTIHQLEYDRYAPQLAELDAGLCLAVENGDLTAAELSAWAERNSYLTLDAEHAWMYSNAGRTREEALAAIGELLAAHGRKLRHVHLPGNRGGPEEHRPMTESPEFVTAVFDRLAAAGFAGFVVSEVDQEYQTLEVLVEDRRLFETWLEARRS